MDYNKNVRLFLNQVFIKVPKVLMINLAIKNLVKVYWSLHLLLMFVSYVDIFWKPMFLDRIFLYEDKVILPKDDFEI